MEKRERRLLQRYGTYKGVQPQRLDHFGVLAPNVQGAIDFNAALVSGVPSMHRGGLDAPQRPWMHRKGNVHDLAFTNGRGPRLHRAAYWVPTPLQVIHLSDLMATTGYLANLERGPGRHGISNAFFLLRSLPRRASP